MANHAGLKKVVKTVRGKKGTVRRSYWMKSVDGVKSGAKRVGGFLNKHKGKIAAGAALVGTAYLGHKYGRSAIGAMREMHKSGVNRATKEHKAANHPDREAQGRKVGKAGAAWAAAKGYARGAARSKPGQAASASAERAGQSVRNAATGAAGAGARAGQKIRSAAVGAKHAATNYRARKRAGGSFQLQSSN